MCFSMSSSRCQKFDCDREDASIKTCDDVFKSCVTMMISLGNISVKGTFTQKHNGTCFCPPFLPLQAPPSLVWWNHPLMEILCCSSKVCTVTELTSSVTWSCTSDPGVWALYTQTHTIHFHLPAWKMWIDGKLVCFSLLATLLFMRTELRKTWRRILLSYCPVIRWDLLLCIEQAFNHRPLNSYDTILSTWHITQNLNIFT